MRDSEISLWQSSGWSHIPKPEALLRAEARPEGEWTEAMRAAGWEQHHVNGDWTDGAPCEWIIHAHPEAKILLVEIWLGDARTAWFIVREGDAAAFVLDRYMPALCANAGERAAAALERISVTLTAFVRHGHGQHVINAGGTWTRDDADAAREVRITRRSAAH